MADLDRDADGGPDEQALRALLSALTRVAPAGSAPWSQEPSLHLVELFRNLDAIDRERLAALARPAAPTEGPARTDCAWDLPTSRDEETTAADPEAEAAGRAPRAPASPAQAPPAPPSREGLSGRYELIKVHARGGIGQVWRARDRQLPRMVAVKELQPRVADREDLRARFLVEAEITGRLEHPGIVPVYSLGEDEAGRPYYAMRFVRGHSLSRAIRDFHRTRQEAEAAGLDPGRAWGLDFRLLLRRFVGACETLEYAHSQGCIHRDLKPGNIMVGPYGETLVVDWGLGKILGSGPEPAPPPSADDDEAPRLTPISATSPGDRIGTPQYMSPEQALGALERVGPRSDVYSLGATLFELLTGKVPFDGQDPHAVTVAVLRGARPPRSELASIPAALDAICAKAMAFKPEDRYPSAGMLARDLESWLADEPVSAREESRRERLARWARRHRTWAAAAAVVLVAVSLTTTAAALAIGRSWRNESAARGQAEANFESAQETVDKYLTRISQDELLAREDSVDLRRLRRDLLREALAYYERFAREHADDDRLKVKLARAYENVGVIQLVIATPQDAVAPLESAVRIWDELLANATDGRGPIAERAWVLSKLGQARKAQGLLREALAALEGSVAALGPIVARAEGMERWGGTLADALSDVAAIRAELGAVDESLAASADARRLLERLAAESPDDADLGVKLAEVVNNQGFVSQKRRDHAGALRCYEGCEAVCRARLAALPKDAPRPLRLLELVGLGAANTGNVLTETGHHAEAERAYLRSLEARQALAEAHPTVVRYRLQLGQTYSSLGDARRLLGRDAEALAALGEARSTFEGLIARDPDDVDARGRLARTLNTIGCIRDDREEHREAVPEFRRAVDEYRRAIAGAAEVVDLRFGLALSLANLAEQHADLGELGPTRSAWDEAARALLDVLRDPAAGPSHVPICLALATTSGDVRLHTGDAEGALARFEEVADAIRDARAADGATRASAAADLDVRRVAAHLAAGRADAAEHLLDRLEADLRARGPAARSTLSEVLWLRAAAARRAGRAADAVEAERADLWTPADADALVAKASTIARRACLVGHGRPPLPAVGRAARDLDAAQAADDLRLALALGFADLARIRADGDLMKALDRPESRSLRDDLAFPELPFAPGAR
ncbi:MAG: hypothetical protein BGO49_22460 [Planctomycetales bacterium 71-10]|nr:MAG: hypothetical protein BGO49_22460 [Planctomycetales bacterium 71-10]